MLDITEASSTTARTLCKVNEHNAGSPRFLLEEWEKQAIVGFHLNYARRRNRCWLVEGATPFGTPENSALKQ